MSLDIRVIQIKTISRFHVTTVRSTIIKNTKQIRLAWKPGNDASACYTVFSTGVASMEMSVEVSQKTIVRTGIGSCCRAHGYPSKRN